MNKYDVIINKLKKAKTVAVFLHINPDCDCIGSAIALSKFLRKDGKNVDYFSPDLASISMISDKYLFLPGIEEFNKISCERYELSVGVDIGDVGRLGEIAFKKFIKSKDTIIIDHHEIHEDFAKYTYRESNSASTTQILYKIMKQYNESLIDSEIAMLLYAGMVTDSGCFSFENTTSETHRIASELMKYDFKAHEISEKLMNSISLEVFNLKNKVLSNAKFYENGRLAIMVYRKEDFIETGTFDKDTDGIINALKNVNSVDLAISIAEVGDKAYKVSFRSKNSVNAASCARCFGGGGHYRAAGCRLYGYFEDVYNKILTVAKEMLDND